MCSSQIYELKVTFRHSWETRLTLIQLVSFHINKCDSITSNELTEHISTIVNVNDEAQLVYAAQSHLIVSKSLLLQIKDYLNADPRAFFSFRKDNEAERGMLTPAQPHCFSAFIAAFSAKYRPKNRVPFKEINEINADNVRMVQNRALKSIYDVEAYSEHKDSKVDLLPPIYAKVTKQPDIAYKLVPEKKCTGELIIFVKTSRTIGTVENGGKTNRDALREYISELRPKATGFSSLSISDASI